MRGQMTYRMPHGDDELRQFGSISARAFSEDEARYHELLPKHGEQNIRVVERAGEIVAGLVIYDMGQFFGGRSLRNWGVSCVAVSPHHRGSGVGAELMRGCLHDIHAAKVPLSALYPATRSLYRRLGWELAGCRTVYQGDVSRMPALAPALALRELRDTDDATVRELYGRSAVQMSGNLDRDDAIWRRVRYATEPSRLNAYLIEEDGRPVGYIYFVNERPSPGTFRFDLTVKDLAFDNLRAGQRILALLANHRTVVRNVTLALSPDSSLHYLTPESAFREVSRIQWMLRIVDVKAALEGRGWPSGFEATLDIAVVDDALDANNGAYRLSIRDGLCTVESIRAAAVSIDVRGLAALYTGWLTPYALRKIGYLSGDSSSDPVLQTLFAGPTPWMPDIF